MQMNFEGVLTLYTPLNKYAKDPLTYLLFLLSVE